MLKEFIKRIDKKKTIVLPEGEDERIIDAAKKINFCNLIIIGKNININKKNVKVIDNENYDDIDKLTNSFYELRKHKGITKEDAKKELLNNKILFGCMLVNNDIADGIVAGICHTSSDTIRAALQTIGTKNGFASAFVLADTKRKDLGYKGFILYSDTGLNQNPNSHELSIIGEQSKESFEEITGSKANIAFLSHSTHGSSKCDDSKKVIDAYHEFRERNKNVSVDGELQFDAAIDENIRFKKAPNSSLKENANTFIFPDLDAGNIAYKITERIGNCKCYGPVLQGMKKPVSDLSRGSSIDDVIGTVLIVLLMTN